MFTHYRAEDIYIVKKMQVLTPLKLYQVHP